MTADASEVKATDEENEKSDSGAEKSAEKSLRTRIGERVASFFVLRRARADEPIVENEESADDVKETDANADNKTDDAKIDDDEAAKKERIDADIQEEENEKANPEEEGKTDDDADGVKAAKVERVNRFDSILRLFRRKDVDKSEKVTMKDVEEKAEDDEVKTDGDCVVEVEEATEKAEKDQEETEKVADKVAEADEEGKKPLGTPV